MWSCWFSFHVWSCDCWKEWHAWCTTTFFWKKKIQEKETRLQCKERLINKSRNRWELKSLNAVWPAFVKRNRDHILSSNPVLNMRSIIGILFDNKNNPGAFEFLRLLIEKLIHNSTTFFSMLMLPGRDGAEYAENHYPLIPFVIFIQFVLRIFIPSNFWSCSKTLGSDDD